MLEALLEPVDARATEPARAPLPELTRFPGAPDERVLAILRDIPEVDCLLTGGLLASWHSSFGSLHSRRWHRVAYYKPLLITPLDDATERPSARSFVAQGRDLSLSGCSFCHPDPLASRKVIVRFRAEDRSGGAILAVLRWCRYRRDGFYQSGGQFLRCAPVDGGFFSPDWSDATPAVTACS
jgi:hypothetical protein